MKKLLNFLDKVISVCIYGVFFLIPLFFLPFTSEMVEFNKQFLLYLLVIIGLVAWVGKGIAEKKLTIRRTPFDIPLVLIILTILVSSIISKNRHFSFWGDYSLLTNSLISFVFYILFYVLVLNNVESVKKVSRLLAASVISAIVSILYFLVQSFNLLNLKNLPIPRWTVTADLPTHFGYFLVVMMIALLSLVITKKGSFWSVKNILGLLGVIAIFTGILFLGFKSVWLIAAVAIFLLLVFSLSRAEEVHLPWMCIGFGIMVAAILFILLGQPRILTANLPTEVALSPGISWDITVASLSENLKQFLFGSGPATFVYDFSAYRPEAFNNNFAWDVRFTRPYNTAMEFLANNGLLGAVAMISFFLVAIGMLFVTWFVKNVRAKNKLLEKISGTMHLADGSDNASSHTIFSGLITAWFTLLIAMFFITFTTVHWVMFFGILALAYLVGSDFAKTPPSSFELSLKAKPQYTLVASFAYILFFAGIVVLMIYLGRFYAGEVYREKAVKYTSLGNHTKAASDMFKAVSLNPNYHQYYLDLASAYVGMAIVESQKSSPDQQKIASLVASAVNQAREATRLAPNDAASWDFLATMYATARPLSSNANSFVISSLEQAIKLEKTNPRLYLDYGRAKVLQKDLKGGREALGKAIALKPNYVLGYSTLSQLDELEGNINQAIEHMSTAASLSQNDPVLLFNLGRLYYNRAKQDDLARAEQLFIMALSINQNYADALWSLGLLYERQNRLADALQLYRRVQQLNPNNPAVQDKIRQLTGGQ